MAVHDTSLDAEAMARARELIAPVAAKERMWPVVAAAALAAVAALSFATAMIVAPPVITQHLEDDGSH